MGLITFRLTPASALATQQVSTRAPGVIGELSGFCKGSVAVYKVKGSGFRVYSFPK